MATSEPTEKACSVCGITKPIEQYNVQRRRGQLRHVAHCKACATLKSAEWVKKNPEKRKAIWRKHAEENRDKYAANNRAYYRRHRERRMQTMQAYWAANPQKREARHRVAYALQTGQIQRGPCEKCGSTKKVHAHHADYSKPLDIQWLCTLCHGKEHRAG